MSYAGIIVIDMAKLHSNALGRRAALSYLWPTLLYAVGIFGLSSIPDLRGPELPVIPFDKAAHVLEYTGFALLVTRSASYHFAKSSSRSQYLISWFIVAAFGAVDELYQSVVPGRTPDVVDFLADICGGGFAILLIWLWRRRQNGRQRLK